MLIVFWMLQPNPMLLDSNLFWVLHYGIKFSQNYLAQPIKPCFRANGTFRQTFRSRSSSIAPPGPSLSCQHVFSATLRQCGQWSTGEHFWRALNYISFGPPSPMVCRKISELIMPKKLKYRQGVVKNSFSIPTMQCTPENPPGFPVRASTLDRFPGLTAKTVIWILQGITKDSQLEEKRQVETVLSMPCWPVCLRNTPRLH